MKNLRPKKSLGQNFLKSKSALSAIVTAGDLKEGDIVLEIGPGKGALTEFILAKGAHIVAVEKDRELVEYLKEKFSDQVKSGALKLIEADILTFIPEEHHLMKGEYKIIANIPYYITGAIIRKFLEAENHPALMVLLMQNEVAKRIVARDKKESLLSIAVKAYGEPKYMVKVPKKAFTPSPKVDSAVLLVENINHGKFSGEQKSFFDILRAGFAHKRKFVIRNLEEIANKSSLIKAFELLNIPQKARPENLNLETWLKISKELPKL